MWIDLVPTWLTTCSLFCRSSDHVFEAKQLSQSQASLEQDAPQTCWVTLMWAGMELGTLQVRSEHDQSIGFPLAFWRGDRTRKMTRHWERRNNEWENGWITTNMFHHVSINHRRIKNPWIFPRTSLYMGTSVVIKWHRSASLLAKPRMNHFTGGRSSSLNAWPTQQHVKAFLNGAMGRALYSTPYVPICFNIPFWLRTKSYKNHCMFMSPWSHRPRSHTNEHLSHSSLAVLGGVFRRWRSACWCPCPAWRLQLGS